VSPTGQPDGFFVPVFDDPEHSNHPLVQIVDAKNRIQAFEPFLSPVEVAKIGVSLTKNVGDYAFWYFKLRSGPIFGTIEQVRSQFVEKKYTNDEESPFVILQITTACQMVEREAAIQLVYDSLLASNGRASAHAWLDTSVLSPRIREWLSQQVRRNDAEFLLMLTRLLAVTSDNATSLLVPDELLKRVEQSIWRELTKQLGSYLKTFELTFDKLAAFDTKDLRAGLLSNVLILKREATSAFAQQRGTTLQQLTNSYFEDRTGSLRVVCTFSSRYERKGKRKYWFGYHETWNTWLEGARESFLILGCIDTRICFALPLQFIRTQLPHLRSTGTGKDKYWHIDIVDLPNQPNLLDIPRLAQALKLSDFSFTF
jgi:hypothetical protein